MGEFEFIADFGLEWVDAADVKRLPQLEHFYMVDTRPYAAKLVLIHRIKCANGSVHTGWYPILRGYYENKNLFISSGDKLFVISKPKEHGKVWIYRRPIKKQRT